MHSISTSAPVILDVKDLRTVFATRDGTVHAVNGVSFHLREGELLGIVGESGSGKSVTMMSLLKLVPMPPAEITSGTVVFGGQDLLQLSPSEVRRVRGGPREALEGPVQPGRGPPGHAAADRSEAGGA